MEQGIIVKGIGGFYEVQTDSDLVVCRLRGRLRLQDAGVLVGDRVEISREGPRGVVESILPRHSVLNRPPVANVDQVFAVMAVKTPEPNLAFLDRVLIHSSAAGLESIVIFNKADLEFSKAKEFAASYEKAGYKTAITSVKKDIGLDQLSRLLQGKITALAGPSGVGKSSLINAIQPGLELETGSISAKLKRGKHTTRSVQLLALNEGGFVADTPGFSRLEVPGIEKEDLQHLFPEFSSYYGECRFRGCLHNQEPKCAIKAAVQAGDIMQHRYDHYLMFLEEIEQAQPY